jgi:hypothetical protein
MLGGKRHFSDDLAGLLALCAKHGQRKPTPLLLQYDEGGYNCLHQDLYGEVAFPLQITCVLSRRGVDFSGGESLLVEQRPRQQSRGDAVPMEQAAAVFKTCHRPRAAPRVPSRDAQVWRSRVLSGHRTSLGVIFHNAGEATASALRADLRRSVP